MNNTITDDEPNLAREGLATICYCTSLVQAQAYAEKYLKLDAEQTKANPLHEVGEVKSADDLLDELTEGKKGLFNDEIQVNYDDAIKAIHKYHAQFKESAPIKKDEDDGWIYCHNCGRVKEG
jgi:hypothetical protein